MWAHEMHETEQYENPADCTRTRATSTRVGNEKEFVRDRMDSYEERKLKERRRKYDATYYK